MFLSCFVNGDKQYDLKIKLKYLDNHNQSTTIHQAGECHIPPPKVISMEFLRSTKENERLLSESFLSPVGFTISLGYRSGYLMILRFGRHDGPAGTSIWRRSRVLLIYRPVTGIKHQRVSIYQKFCLLFFLTIFVNPVHFSFFYTEKFHSKITRSIDIMSTMCSAHCIYNRQTTLFLCVPIVIY